MAGDFFAKERTLVALTTTGASLTTGSGGAAGTDLDCRASGNAADDFQGQFELKCQWATVTGIVAGTSVADLYLVPKLDGTNLPDLDLTSGTSAMPLGSWAGTLVATKTPTANTDARFISSVVNLNPLLYTVHIINRSGQTISASWTLNVVTWRAQYS